MYRPGKKNANADALSWNPCSPPPVCGLAEFDSQVARVTTAPTVSTSGVPTPYFLVPVYFSVSTYSLSVGAESRSVPPGKGPTGAESHVDPPPIPSRPLVMNHTVNLQ